MKNLIFAYLLFFPVLVFGQVEPFKGVNTLVVTSTQENLFDAVMTQLIQDGFEIKESNEKYQTINTGWKFYQNTIYYRMVISIQDQKVSIRGYFKNDAVNAVFNANGSETPITWAKSGGLKYMWLLMDTFGSNFGTQKEYFKK